MGPPSEPPNSAARTPSTTCTSATDSTLKIDLVLAAGVAEAAVYEEDADDSDREDPPQQLMGDL